MIYQKRVGQNMPQQPGFNKSVMTSYPLGIRSVRHLLLVPATSLL